MIASQLGLLLVEAAVMAALVLALFRIRSVLGLSPLYIVMGGFQYLEATLTVTVELWPGFTIYPGSSVMFTANLFAVLLVYLKEDATEARKLVYGLVLANAGLMLLSLLVSAHIMMEGGPSAQLDAQALRHGAEVAIVGATLMFIDVVGIILVYEWVSKFIPWVYLRILTALLTILAFDNFFFVGFQTFGEDNVGQAMLAGLAGKAGAALFYSTVLWGYLRFVEPRDIKAGDGDLADVFQMLTYRQKYEIARRRMIHDTLTGLYNRLHFDEVVPQMLAHARRYGEPLSLLIIDGDHFKQINDRFSHLEGDRVIALMGETFGSEVRAADIACRYGGDEFVIVLPRTDAEAARAFAERCQVRLRERCAFASPPFPWGTLTITIGIACYPADGDFTTLQELVAVADMRLYEGKRLGGNSVVWESPPPAAAVAQGFASRRHSYEH